VCIKKANTSEPSYRRRYKYSDIKTGYLDVSRDKPNRNLFTG